MAVKVNRDTCIGCEACVGTCPTEAITMNDGKAEIDQNACVECGACIGECPTEAIVQE